MFEVKEMSTQDIAFAVSVTEEMGWSLSEEDFKFMMELEPDCCLVLFDHGERMGIVTIVSFGRVGWLGNLIVSQSHRRKGAGSALVTHGLKCIKEKKVGTIGLFAYLNKVPFYERLGFVRHSELVVLTGRGFHSSARKGDVREAQSEDINDIIDYDHGVLGMSRAKMLGPIISDPDNLCYMAFENGKMSGYAVAKVFRGMAEVGPLLCQQGHYDTAASLLKALLTRLGRVEVSLFVSKEERAILDMLARLQFREEFSLVEMFSGPPFDRKCIYLPESLERG